MNTICICSCSSPKIQTSFYLFYVFQSATMTKPEELGWVSGQSNNSDTLLKYMHSWPSSPAALYLSVFQLVKSTTSHNTRVSPGSRVGKQIRRNTERKRVPYVGEKHVLIPAVFLLFQLHGPTSNEDREQGSRLDRGGEGRGG